MSKKISKIENFNYQNIVTLNQSVADKRFLMLDLWEDIRTGASNIPQHNHNRYNQIFLQINDLHVLNFSEGRVFFDLTDRADVIDAITSIETKIISLLKNYLASIHKKGKFSFRSVIKDDRGDKKQGNVVLALNLSNQDYEVSFYDIAKKRSNCSLINKQYARFNIILELMYINFDMKKGEIVADTRMRMCMETRIRMMDVDLFIQDEKKSSDKNQSKTQSVEQSFDITQTDVFEEDVPEKIKKESVRQNTPTNEPVDIPKHIESGLISFEEIEKDNDQSLGILDMIIRVSPQKQTIKPQASASQETKTMSDKQMSDKQMSDKQMSDNDSVESLISGNDENVFSDSSDGENHESEHTNTKESPPVSVSTNTRHGIPVDEKTTSDHEAKIEHLDLNDNNEDVDDDLIAESEALYESEDELIAEDFGQDQSDITSDNSNVMENLNNIYKQTEINRQKKKAVTVSIPPSNKPFVYQEKENKQDNIILLSNSASDDDNETEDIIKTLLKKTLLKRTQERKIDNNS
jgi:hypothetical protein